jgi:hypothetical protein
METNDKMYLSEKYISEISSKKEVIQEYNQLREKINRKLINEVFYSFYILYFLKICNLIEEN